VCHPPFISGLQKFAEVEVPRQIRTISLFTLEKKPKIEKHWYEHYRSILLSVCSFVVVVDLIAMSVSVYTVSQGKQQ
jgi:hypothetical protein